MAYQFAPRRAFRAARALAADPDDLPQVFTIIESLSGGTLQRIARRIGRSDAGRRMLATRPDIVDRLADRAALARLPEGSLGRAYLAFVERENISADGIRAAGRKGMTNEGALPAPLDWVHARMRDTHDLWHAAVGYSGDVLGETALLAFTFAQTKNPAIGLILGVGLSKTLGAPNGGAQARRTILDGYRRGARAAWLPGQPWEEMLSLPLDEVRRRLRLESPPVYTEIRSADIRAARRLVRRPRQDPRQSGRPDPSRAWILARSASTVPSRGSTISCSKARSPSASTETRTRSCAHVMRLERTFDHARPPPVRVILRRQEWISRLERFMGA